MIAKPNIVWRELYDLVREKGTLLVNEDDRGYMELSVPDEFDTTESNLWRNNQPPEQAKRTDLLCLHLNVPGPYADEHESIDVELPPEYSITLDELGGVVIPHGFDPQGNVRDYLDITFIDGHELLPTRNAETGELMLLRWEVDHA